MGIESFRIDVFFNNVFNVDKVIGLLNSEFKIKNSFYMKKTLFNTVKHIIQNQYLVDDYILLEFEENEKYMCLQSCFSNYDYNLEKMFDILSLIRSGYIISISMGNINIKLNDIIDLSDCEYYISDFYNDKYQLFMEKYNLLNINLRPGDDFFNYVNRT